MAANVDYQVAIIGGGFGGLGLGIRLKEVGESNFVIFERADQVGGTWRDNVYPGCGCDIPSHLYSFSFETNPNWSREYSKQPEILDYIIRCKDKYELDAHIQYNTEIIQSEFDESLGIWKLVDKNNKSYTAKVVVSAIGPLNVPNIPDLKGLDSFEGEHFHSSEWDTNVDLKNKKVAIIGTGASAIQIIPNIVDDLKTLTLFQRTAPWILPKNDHQISGFMQKVYSALPFLQRIKREGYYWFYEYAGGALFKDNLTRRITRRMARKHLEKQVKDPQLRKKLRPNYEIGCKRRLPSDDYYPALVKEQVHVVTDGIAEIQANGIVDQAGVFHEADLLIFATGFHVANFKKRNISVLGRNGESLFDTWETRGPEGYYGTCIANFPGLLFVLGPNTGLGHNSQLHIIESQFNFILNYLEALKKLPATASLNVTPKAQEAFNQQLDESLSTMVWSTGGCSSWYLHESGRNSALWPGYTATYRKKTKRLIMSDFEVVGT